MKIKPLFIVISAPSGCGKSTLIDMLLQEYPDIVYSISCTTREPRGEEEDIVLATEAAYDAGARTLLAWGYYGSISNDYGAKNAPVTWARTCEAFRRVRDMERDRLLAEARAKYKK